MRRTIAAVLTVLALAGAARAADPERRVSLIIGNAAYQKISALSNPAHDAVAIGGALQRAGFQLVGGKPLLDLDKPGMERAIREFGRLLEGGAVAFLYYSGHGMQIGDRNYMIPVEAAPNNAREADFELVAVDLAMKQIAAGGGRLSIVVLDACRNNPFAGQGARASGGGLAAMDAPAGSVIAYATSPGKTASDGPAGGNSPYAKALARALGKLGVGVLDVFNEVGVEVEQGSSGRQQPWLAVSPLRGRFQFLEGPAQTASAPASGGAIAPSSDPETLFWQTIVGSTRVGDYQAYLKQYPTGRFAELAKARAGGDAAPQPAQAAPQTPIAEVLKQAEAAEDARDYKKAFPLYLDAAKRGNAIGQFNVGYFYRKGWAVAEDPAEAAAWYRKAAEQGHPTTQNNLGFLYDEGIGVKRDPAQARIWYGKAAEQGNASAQANLGWMYARGKGGAKDADRARFWFKKAADQGNNKGKDGLAALGG